MRILQPLILASIVICVSGVRAGVPSADFSEAARLGQKILQNRLERQFANAWELVDHMMRAYDAEHSPDAKLDSLSTKELRRLAQARTNDLILKFMLLQSDLTDDIECAAWFETLKAAYALCTNQAQKVACLGIGTVAMFQLQPKPFGKGMLGELGQWLKKLSAERPPLAVAAAIRNVRLTVALGTDAYSEAPVYATGTPFRTLIPLWMMSKGKWELALTEVRKLKELSDLDTDEKSALDFFESLLKDLVDKRPDK